jgi:bifunctional UDP-N-acetylglucosamine pyrophosphorylase/glucosamine-1-phosphate N-acetyltransferase
MAEPVAVVILAAGLGTRMKSQRAKVLHRAGGLCLLEHVVRAARQLAPPERIVAVVGHQAEQVMAELAPAGIGFVRQDQQLGTGHALRVCSGHPALAEGRILVVYGDGPLLSAHTLTGLLERHEESGAAATLVTAHMEDPYGYGRILPFAPGFVAAIVEEKAATPEQKRIKEVNPGIYCFEAAALWPVLAGLEPNPASGEVYLTDMAEALNAAGHRVAAHPLEDPNELLGINTRIELAHVDRLLRERKTRELMLAGVTIERPETVLVDPDVTAGPDTIIGPFVQLLGRTALGSGCRVGACSIVRNTELADGAEIQAFCSVEDSRLGPGASVGPYARLRMGAEVAADAHVGNFVELKKTRLGAGSKAMHLAYLGDSTIGEKCNIGAGAITCNYDGVKKSQTAIGDGAFVGSNSTLVAPLEIGAGSYIAAGSVVTEQVPADALALGRSRQTNKAGWASRRREVLSKRTH